MNPAPWVVMGLCASALLLSWGYFRRYQLTRPPLGVVNLWDVAVLLGGIAGVPYLYLALPAWGAVALFGAALLSILSCLGEPVLRTRAANWTVVPALLGADIGAVHIAGTTSPLFWIVNDAILLLAVAGISNLWAQGGMRAQHAAVLAGALAIYDLVATSWLPLTNDLVTRLAGNPFTPLVVWGAGHDRLGIGLGDLLLAAVYPLVSRKAFGRPAGRVALALSLATIGTLLALVELRGVRVTLPVMALLGPLMVAQYLYWRRRSPERTTRQYLQADPVAPRERPRARIDAQSCSRPLSRLC